MSTVSCGGDTQCKVCVRCVCLCDQRPLKVHDKGRYSRCLVFVGSRRSRGCWGISFVFITFVARTPASSASSSSWTKAPRAKVSKVWLRLFIKCGCRSCWLFYLHCCVVVPCHQRLVNTYYLWWYDLHVQWYCDCHTLSLYYSIHYCLAMTHCLHITLLSVTTMSSSSFLTFLINRNSLINIWLLTVLAQTTCLFDQSYKHPSSGAALSSAGQHRHFSHPPPSICTWRLAKWDRRHHPGVTTDQFFTLPLKWD